jgi:uncharacterized protein YeaO (DUF488 family)
MGCQRARVPGTWSRAWSGPWTRTSPIAGFTTSRRLRTGRGCWSIGSGPERCQGGRRLDEWLRDIAPSTELRRWYSHKPDRFTEFRRRYLAELTEPQRRQAARHLRQIAHQLDLTLLTATRDLDHSQAAVLAQWRDEHPSRST